MYSRDAVGLKTMSKVGESQDELVNKQRLSPAVDDFSQVHEDERWSVVERVLESGIFRRSPRLKEFLRFVVERTLAGQTSHLTESEIGRLVFGRGDDYVPTDDSIVRSSARQLRMKLREYFDTEGREERWIIEMPKGGYAVLFQERPVSAEPIASPIDQAAAIRSSSIPIHAIWIACAAALLIASVSMNIRYLLRSSTETAGVPPQLSLLGSLVMNNSRATQFIMDDYAFVLLSNASKIKPTMDDYASRTYVAPPFIPTADPEFLKLWNLLSTRYLVSFGAAAAAEDALRAVPQQQKLVIRHARNVVPREFKQGNFILFGSPPNNPWAELFEDKLDFRKSASGFNNLHPRADEQASYNAEQDLGINSGTGYARLAYLPNASGDSFVLLLTGINMVTSEAAAEFATDPQRVPELLKLNAVSSLKQLPHFELLLKTYAVDTTPKDVRVVAYRRID